MLGLVGLACANKLTPKNIDIALTARWAATPIAVEAAEFLSDEGEALFWRYVQEYSPPAESSTDREQLAAVETAASALISPLGVKLLRAFLAAHVLSPRVEVWRQLASADEAEKSSLASAAGWVRACGKLYALSSGSAGKTAADAADAAVADGSCGIPPSLEARELSNGEAPLSVDHRWGGASDSLAPTVILSAPVGSAAFRDAHAELVRRASDRSITYVFRPLVRAAEAGAASQTLQGYGVQLAIKNMEYKAMDDKSVADLGEIGDADSGAEGAAGVEELDVGGFYFGTLYLPCTFPVPSLYLPCTFPVGGRLLLRHPRLAAARAQGAAHRAQGSHRRGGGRRELAQGVGAAGPRRAGLAARARREGAPRAPRRDLAELPLPRALALEAARAGARSHFT